jgi:hypothetical protein
MNKDQIVNLYTTLNDTFLKNAQIFIKLNNKKLLLKLLYEFQQLVNQFWENHSDILMDYDYMSWDNLNNNLCSTGYTIRKYIDDYSLMTKEQQENWEIDNLEKICDNKLISDSEIY